MGYIKISLLPSELKKRSSVMRRWTLFSMVLSILAFALVLVSFLVSSYVRGPINELHQLEDENDILTTSISGLSYIQEMYDSIEYNNNIIISIKGEEIDWPFVYNVVSNDITLYNITVKQIQLDSTAVDINGVIVGECDTIKDAIAWAESTRQLSEIESVELTDISIINANSDNPAFYFKALFNIIKWNAE